MTPLIDVVFLLIIFFLVSSHLVQQDVSMEIDLPAAETGKLSDLAADRTIVLNVPDTERLFWGSTPMTLESLEVALKRRVETPRRSPGRPVAVRLRLAHDVPYATLESILTLCARCGVTDIAFAVTEP